MIRFILASQSPRRQELLALAGYPFQVMATAVDEETIDHPDPEENTLQTARLKAQAIVARRLPLRQDRVIVIAADTTVALADRLMGKPSSAAGAAAILRSLRGTDHQVHTGVALVDLATGQEVTGVHTASVTMRSYTDREIEQYIASGDPMDKAGAYAIQHAQFRPVAALEGCYLGVMGLSICHLLQLLQQLDIPLVANLDDLAQAHGHFACPIQPQSKPSLYKTR